MFSNVKAHVFNGKFQKRFVERCHVTMQGAHGVSFWEKLIIGKWATRRKRNEKKRLW
jgi:hypothetical protein